MSKPRGRPKKPLPDVKSAPVQFRMSNAEKAAFQAAAELSGLTLSAWMRERLRSVARDELGSAGREIPFLSQASPKSD